MQVENAGKVYLLGICSPEPGCNIIKDFSVCATCVIEAWGINEADELVAIYEFVFVNLIGA